MWEKYTTVRELGRGGMGIVSLVVDRHTRLPYVAKQMSEDLMRSKDKIRFHREIEALATLDHPNIAKIYDTPSEDERPLGYIMEYCPGGDLDNLPNPDVWSIVSALIAAVSAIHSRKLVHRDIKPGNILIAFDGTPRLADFGLVTSTDPDREIITTSNWVSPGFAPPEQFLDMASVDGRADIYAIGAVWFYLLTQRPYDFNKPFEPQMRGVLPETAAILARCLAYSVNERFANISDLATNAAIRVDDASLDDDAKQVIARYRAAPAALRASILDDEFGAVDDWLGYVDLDENMGGFFRDYAIVQSLLILERDPALRERLAELHGEMKQIDRKII